MLRSRLLLAALSAGLLVGCTAVLGSFEVSDSAGPPAPDGGDGADGGGGGNDSGGGGNDSGGPTDSGSDVDVPAGSFLVTVKKSGNGGGGVLSAPPGITCGEKCSAPFAAGSTITLKAAAGPGSTFLGWSGPCGGTGDCVFTVDKAVEVDARFQALPRQLTVVKNGAGQGNVSSAPNGINCGASCNGTFPNGTKVTLTATPQPGHFFAGWRDGCAGAQPTCEVTLDGDVSVQAEFAIPTTWDPAWSVAGVTYSNGNLSISGNSTGVKNVRTVAGRATGKFYWEVKATGGSSATNHGGLGIVEKGMPNNVGYIGLNPSGMSFGYGGNPTYWLSWAGASVNGQPPTSSYVSAGITYMFALDADNGRLFCGQDGTWYNGGSPATGTNPAVSGLSGTIYPGVTFYASSTNAFTANFGALGFNYTPPVGFARGF